MLHLAPVFNKYCRKLIISSVFPYFSLFIWILPLLIFTSAQTSLMAHDEGLYAGRAKMMFDSGDWIHPWASSHHKTPGYYWIIACSYKLFGVSESSVRIPSIIFGILCVFILYEISKIILNSVIAWLAGAIFSVEFLWLQYCRLGNPDVVMIFLVLLAILALLKAENSVQNRSLLYLLAGFSFGLGFLIRSFMMFLPIAALFPYLVGEHRRHHHLNNFYLYLGFIIGLIPTFIWVWLSFLNYGNEGVTELAKFAIRLGSSERQGNGIFFYFWNISLKSFPWFFLAMLGLIIKLQKPLPKYQLLLVAFPIVLFLELTFFSTRLSHYSLCLYPFIAILAAIGLDHLSKIYQSDLNFQNSSFAGNSQGVKTTKVMTIKRQFMLPKDFLLIRNFSYLWGLFGIALLTISSLVTVIGNPKLSSYVTLSLISGFSFLIVPMIFWGRYHRGKKSLSPSYLIAGCLIPAWLGLAVAGGSGFLGNYNPDFKTFVEQQAIAQILKSSPVNFVDTSGKTEVLMSFYTRISGVHTENAASLPPQSYAWISNKQLSQLSLPYQILGKLEKYSLVHLSK
jgi:4-amino-4-deoxy-L-arabinose transferase-like glycosyltransferase